jgi:hypothetical protein
MQKLVNVTLSLSFLRKTENSYTPLLLSHERAAGEPAVSYENKGSVAPLLPDITPLYYAFET